jgi:hypothetical protein
MRGDRLALLGLLAAVSAGRTQGRHEQRTTQREVRLPAEP